MQFTKAIPLHCRVQHYAWGRAASESIIPSLLEQADLEQPQAELWVGAHPSAPAELDTPDGRVGLDTLIAAHPEQLLGKAVVERFGARLPFLFKVLSIRTALSIQAHPDKQTAERLHAEDPKHYPDDNHKPEVAIAVSPVSLLYGFRSPQEIAQFCQTVPELADLLSSVPGTSSGFIGEKPLLVPGTVYPQLFQTDEQRVQELCRKMYKRLAALQDRTPEEEWVLQLSKEYPQGDVGVFCFFLLNLVQRAPGEGVFIGANIPHAYLEGELIECMANSDNVVRAGLTPKYKDVKTLLAIADYNVAAPALLAKETLSQEGCERFKIPAREFSLSRLSGSSSVVVAAADRVELLFCLSGKGSLGGDIELRPGTALLLPAGMPETAFEFQEAEMYWVSVPDS